MHEKTNGQSKKGFNDPYRYLKEEHRAIISLMDELSGAEGGKESELGRDELWKKLRTALASHVGLEASTLYPMLSERAPTRAPVERAHKTHERMQSLIDALGERPARTEEWADMLHMLRTQVERHIDEGEHELIPLSKSALGDEGSAALMERMERYRAGAPA